MSRTIVVMHFGHDMSCLRRNLGMVARSPDFALHLHQAFLDLTGYLCAVSLFQTRRHGGAAGLS